ncbi:MAG: InlB B-repeat-containing protein [Candidatus Saccharibacteria bacterium]|nr:InlB B-repeat-containing protein [Candidatus Saccharibacteria bacterium]
MIAHRKTVRCGIVVATLVAFVAFGITSINTVAKYVDVEDDTVTLSVRKPHYTVVFDANGGTGMMDNQDFVYGTRQQLTANAFEREGYNFRGWSKMADGSDGSFYVDEQSLVDLSDQDGDVVILYAQWSRFAYYNAGPVTFSGNDNNPINCIDTGIKVYDAENINKNFEISFDVDPNFTYSSLATMMNAMDEGGSPWPGIVFRLDNANTYVLMATGAPANIKVSKSGNVDHVTVKRYKGALYLSVNDREYLVAANAPVTQHNAPVSFGCSMKGNGDFWRPFNGTLSNMSVRIDDDNSYIVSYDANGGVGSMDAQHIEIGTPTGLSKNQFKMREHLLAGWNTEADGSGDSYADEELVQDLTGMHQEVVLYATWRDAGKYTVKFNANGGEGNMADEQFFADGFPYALGANEYTRDGYVFGKWNTRSDGSGKSYLNEQEVINLADEGGEIELYAIWAKEAYTHVADRVFTGTDFDNTGIELFNDANVNNDFEISFDIKEAISTDKQATMVAAMDESGEPWPGVVFRVQNAQLFEISANANGNTKVETRYNREGIKSVRIKRTNKVLYLCFNDSDDCERILDYANILRTFNSPTAFGVSLKPNGTAQRPFKGTLANMSVIVYPEDTSGGE